MSLIRLRPTGSALAFAVAALVAVVHQPDAQAQTASAAPSDRSFNPQLFHPAPGPDEFITVEPALPLGHLQYEVGLFLNYARNELTIYGTEANSSKAGAARADILANRLAADLWAGFGILNRLQLAIA